jgi:hypothetical protein
MIAVLNMLMRHVPLESTKSVSNVKAAAGRYVGTSCPAPLTTTIMGTHALHPKTLMDFDPGSNPEEANATQNNSKKRTKLKIVSVLCIRADVPSGRSVGAGAIPRHPVLDDRKSGFSGRPILYLSIEWNIGVALTVVYHKSEIVVGRKLAVLISQVQRLDFVILSTPISRQNSEHICLCLTDEEQRASPGSAEHYQVLPSTLQLRMVDLRNCC